MDDKKIDASTAGYLMDAMEAFGKLDVELHYLKWMHCYRDDPAIRSIPDKAKRHCRDLREALSSFAYWIDVAYTADKEAAADKIVKIDEKRKP
jgi:hypothetical protein